MFRSGFALDCVSVAGASDYFIVTKADRLLQKCRERYEAYWTKKEIDSIFNEAPENVLGILKLKETYGQEVFWSKIFSDYKPFDAKDWLEDGESL